MEPTFLSLLPNYAPMRSSLPMDHPQLIQNCNTTSWEGCLNIQVRVPGPFLTPPSMRESQEPTSPGGMIFASRPSSLLKTVAVGNAQKSPVPTTTWRHFPGKPQTVRGMLMLKQMLSLDSAFSRALQVWRAGLAPPWTMYVCVGAMKAALSSQ